MARWDTPADHQNQTAVHRSAYYYLASRRQHLRNRRQIVYHTSDSVGNAFKNAVDLKADSLMLIGIYLALNATRGWQEIGMLQDLGWKE